MSTERVDVLAWFDAEIASADSLSADAYQVEHAARLRNHRAAVAELIEAARSVNDELNGPDGVSVATADRLSAALARIGAP